VGEGFGDCEYGDEDVVPVTVGNVVCGLFWPEVVLVGDEVQEDCRLTVDEIAEGVVG